MAKTEHHQQIIRQAGYKLTHARLTVLQAILNKGGHVSSSDVLDEVHVLDEGIGRASVFRTLDLFTQLGIIRPTYIDSHTTPQYVMLPDGHHHHVICTQCSRVFEFEDCGLSQLQRQLEEQYQIQITGHLLEFYALCEACR